MEDMISSLFDIVATFPVGLVLLLVFMAGMYTFWRGCMETEKDRSSIFDVYTISLVFGVVIGRLGYVLNNINDFLSYIWYWSPYEKYSNTIYIFRLLPWRFLRIWDGGIIILTLFVGYLLFASLLTIFVKKWRWRQLFFPIFFSAVSLLSLSFIFVASISKSTDLLIMAAVLLLIFLIFSISLIIVKNLKIKWKIRKKVSGYIGVVCVLTTVAYLSYEIFTGSIAFVEEISMYVLIGWTVVSTILFVIDMRKRKSIFIEKVSNIQGISPLEVNQPIRLPSDEKK